MVPRVALAGLLCVALVGCGGATFAGLGDDLGDGAPAEETSAEESGAPGDDATFATDDGATPGDASDASALGDGIGDASASKDASGEVSSGSDALAKGEVDADADADADAADTGATVDAPPPLLSSNPAQVYCDVGGVKNVLCPAGQQCCGKQPFAGDFSWSCTGGSCNAPTAGSSRSYLCNEKADCGGFLCCVNRGTFGDMNGTHCHTDNSPCGDETACMTDADCPGMQKCAANTIQDGDFTIGMCK